MIRHVGEMVQNDQELRDYAERLWATEKYQDWRRHMRQDVADSMASLSQHEAYPGQA